jgi:hypothetical protein
VQNALAVTRKVLTMNTIPVNVAALLLALPDTNEASDASEGFIDGDGIRPGRLPPAAGAASPRRLAAQRGIVSTLARRAFRLRRAALSSA